MITKEDIVSFFHSEVGSKSETELMESRIRKGESFSNDVPADVKRHMLGWGLAEPGQVAGMHAKKVRELIGPEPQE